MKGLKRKMLRMEGKKEGVEGNESHTFTFPTLVCLLTV